MTYNRVNESDLKRSLLNKTIETLQRWVNTKLVFTDKVEVLIGSTGNDTVDEVSIQFNKPFEMRPGADTVFLALHYKDEDTTLEGDHLRFHHANYGLFDEMDTWVKCMPVLVSKEKLLGEEALINLISLLEEIISYCDVEGWNNFIPNDSVFPYDLIFSEEKTFASLFE